MQPNLRPYVQLDEGLTEYLGYNFSRLQLILEQNPDTRAGTVTVTGSATVPTGLTLVQFVVASFQFDPSAAANYIAANIASGGNISIRVLTSTFALSTTPTNVNFFALGEFAS